MHVWWPRRPLSKAAPENNNVLRGAQSTSWLSVTPSSLAALAAHCQIPAELSLQTRQSMGSGICSSSMATPCCSMDLKSDSVLQNSEQHSSQLTTIICTVMSLAPVPVAVSVSKHVCALAMNLVLLIALWKGVCPPAAPMENYPKTVKQIVDMCEKNRAQRCSRF
jgi:hypothetical protein